MSLANDTSGSRTGLFVLLLGVALHSPAVATAERIIMDAREAHEDAQPQAYNTAVLGLSQLTFAGNVLQADGVAEDWVVFFCAHWEKECQTFSPFFEEQGAKWQGRLNAGRLFTSRMRFAQVDCAVDKSLCNDLDVQEYPAVAHYTRGRQVGQWRATGRKDARRNARRLAKWLDREFDAAGAAGNACALGDTVKALYPDGEYYGAKVAKLNADGTITLQWEDRDDKHRVVRASMVRKGSVTCEEAAKHASDSFAPAEHAANIVAVLVLVCCVVFGIVNGIASEPEQTEKTQATSAPVAGDVSPLTATPSAVGVGRLLPRHWVCESVAMDL